MYTKRLVPMYSIMAGFLIIGSIFFSQHKSTAVAQNISTTHEDSTTHVQGTPAVAGVSTVTDPEQLGVCLPGDIKATTDVQGNSDKRNGTLSMTNVSNKSCKINAGSFIKVDYDKSKIKNLNVVTQGTLLGGMVVLEPGKKLSSSIQYPNGVQCTTGFSEEKIQFSYIISEANLVTFKDAKENADVSVNLCGIQSESTNLVVSNVYL